MRRISIRGVDEAVARQFAAGAAARGITQAEYLRRLIDLRTEISAAMELRDRTAPPFFSAEEAWDLVRSAMIANCLGVHVS